MGGPTAYLYIFNRNVHEPPQCASQLELPEEPSPDRVAEKIFSTASEAECLR